MTEHTAGLEYVDQSGALNESISDQAGWDVDPGDSTSGIPNKVYANLVDALGRGSAAQVRYRAQAVYLGPNATFADARAAEQQAASDLGLSATAVGNAWQAQGVSASWQPPC